MQLKTIAAVFVAVALLAGAAHAQPAKVINDPNEYNAYVAALKLADPTQKGAAMEAFVAKYPHSVVHQDALEQAMAAYQQVGNALKVEALAGEIFAHDRANVRALAVLTALERAHAAQGDVKALAAMRTHAAQGVALLPRWKKPADMRDADYTRLKAQMSGIFHGAAGFAALQDKDYVKARGFYRVAVAVDPGDLQNGYQLAVAELQMTPLDPAGFWHAARAMHLADAQKNAAAVQGIEKYAKAKYASYHGSDDGWNVIVAQAAKRPAPPPGFTVKAK